MEFFRRAAGKPPKLGVLAGTFNPPTLAHLTLARQGLTHAEEVLFVLPRVFPHKPYEGASFEQRLEMLRRAVEDEPRYSIAATDHGLFIDIAQDCRSAYGAHTNIAFLCGRDAAERIVNWDYGRPGAFQEMLGSFELMVVSRKGDYEPPPELRHRIRTLSLPSGFDEVSATAVRERIARGEPWENLVPASIIPLVREIYSRDDSPDA